jgi:hypothetical protein
MGIRKVRAIQIRSFKVGILKVYAVENGVLAIRIT